METAGLDEVEAGFLARRWWGAYTCGVIMSANVASTVWTAVRQCLAGLADLLLPNLCAACDAADVSDAGLCSQCNVDLLSLVSLAYCPRCGATVGPNIPVREGGCWACPNPLPRFAEVIRLGPYARPIRSVVQALKYRRQEAMVARLGELLSQGVQAKCPDRPPDVVVSVPMHWRRRLIRGCDHARLLALAVAGNLSVPLGRELVRVRNTPPQVHLPRTRRIENMRGAFAAVDKQSLAGAHVLLVDDVTTTGATANEATRALLAGGADRVTLAVVAKAEPPRAYSQHLSQE